MKRLILALLLCAAVAPAMAGGRILGGELSNSAATSVADIDSVMPRMSRLGLNTVLVPAYWEFLEPTEGQFDFTLIDRTVMKARENGLRVIFLWFGAWKNSMSCYAPLWFKQDTHHFPRARTRTGKPLEIATPFSAQVLQADKRAFTALMQHLADIDRATGTVAMIQIENEIGMLEDARDHSALAEKAYRQPVPKPLLKALGLNPKPGAQTWADVFGTDVFADEKFMAYHYATYVEQLAQVARQTYDVPLYVNAAMNSRGRKPGEYPSAGPLAHLVDFWQCGAPSIDLLAPDIYDTGFKSWAAQYAMPLRPQDGGSVRNRLFIPESRCCENSGVRALYAFGEHDALGFSPFAIDQASPAEAASVSNAYAIVSQLERMPVRKGQTSWGLLFDQEDKERSIQDNQLCITARHYYTLPWDPRATDGTPWPEGGAMLLRLAPLEYLLAGSGVVTEFKTITEKALEEQRILGEDGFVEGGADDSSHHSDTPHFKGRRIGIGSVDEVTIGADGAFHFLRRHNGDQDHQGRHARIAVGEWKILHIKLYEYQ